LETTGTCEPGSLRCKNETVKQFCGPDGQWTHDVDCAQSGKVCQAGRCEVCLTGATRCNPENPTFSQKCGYAGNFLKWVYNRLLDFRSFYNVRKRRLPKLSRRRRNRKPLGRGKGKRLLLRDGRRSVQRVRGLRKRV
jgi:hypothetical protein